MQVEESLRDRIARLHEERREKFRKIRREGYERRERERARNG